MAVEEKGAVEAFEDWYIDYGQDDRDGCLDYRGLAPCATGIIGKYEHYKREMDARCAHMYKLEMLADNEVLSKKPDLPNVSDGTTAGLVRRMARNLVQHVPNVDITCEFDDDSVNGVFARHILLSKIIQSDEYSNDMQQNLFASTKTALTIGFDCVVPVLLQDPSGSWFIEYDTIHYRDVCPEPGAKDVRKATSVFVRRYLTKGEIKRLIKDQADGWDVSALKDLLKRYPRPPSRDRESNSHQDTKKKVIAEGYEIVTWYSNTGDPFLTFSDRTKTLLRIEENRHPLSWHPVFFLVMEKDSQQPLGKSQVELLVGRQEFQDLMLNGAMKLWYRNINPSILAFGSPNAVPNLSPGKYTNISNPNARVEPFEVNTQTLLQYSAISQDNQGAMVNLVGSADQQMAVQAGHGMSATPQGVNAQQQLVDITTNNYQKAIEQFFSHYCSYALTIYFQELSGIKKVTPSADARQKLLNAAQVMDEQGNVQNVFADAFEEDGSISIDFSDMATQYFVKCVPGSLVELEDEKQVRILNELFVPLSQAMPALAAVQDPKILSNAAQTMMYIIEKTIELSGSSRSSDLQTIFKTGNTQQFNEWQERAGALEQSIGGVAESTLAGLESSTIAIGQLQEQMKLMSETQGLILKKLGAPASSSAPGEPTEENPVAEEQPQVVG